MDIIKLSFCTDGDSSQPVKGGIKLECNNWWNYNDVRGLIQHSCYIPVGLSLSLSLLEMCIASQWMKGQCSNQATSVSTSGSCCRYLKRREKYFHLGRTLIQILLHNWKGVKHCPIERMLLSWIKEDEWFLFLSIWHHQISRIPTQSKHTCTFRSPNVWSCPKSSTEEVFFFFFNSWKIILSSIFSINCLSERFNNRPASYMFRAAFPQKHCRPKTS